MEVAALAGLLTVGYIITKGSSSQHEDVEEPFEQPESDLMYGGMPPPLYEQNKTPAGEPTIPGKPRQPRHTADGELDLYYQLPSGGSLKNTPGTQADLFPRTMMFSSPAASFAPQAPSTAITPQVRMNVESTEAPPIYNGGKPFRSPLTGLEIPAEEFTHNNMVPFYRGSVKQNMADTGNRSILDNHVGAGSTQIAKREQAPLFDPHREPTGNVTGMESTTDFMQDRMIPPTNRAGETPVEAVRVGPGINQGYTPFPTGGFQQMDIDEIMRSRKSVDELRVASNPKITYEGQIIPGKSLALQRGELGETRKYRPDTFSINENGERNLPAHTNARPPQRATEVLKFQSREETTGEAMGPAAATDFKATYAVPSFRAPMARQQDGFGFRNADASTYGTKNTDAQNNDFGRAGYALPTNQRNVTSERGQGLNLTTAGVPSALTVYDPNDVARTTVRESTGSTDWLGSAGPASMAQKLTVYDPTDITRVTARNVNTEPDRAMNVTRAGVPGAGTLQFPDGVRDTQKAALSSMSEYTGSAGAANAKGEQVYDYAYNMRHTGEKEFIASGRKPIAGNGNRPIFNGEDNMNVQYRRIDSDSLNDRGNVINRITGPPLGAEAIGIQRPKNILHLDVSQDRNISEILDNLNHNPYALPVHRIAASIGR
jgi:hypothetical protein